MAIELFDPTHLGADLFSDGLGEFGECVLCDNGPAMVTDYAATADDARRLVLNTANHFGSAFDLKLQRWLCPDCYREFRARKPTLHEVIETQADNGRDGFRARVENFTEHPPKAAGLGTFEITAREIY